MKYLQAKLKYILLILILLVVAIYLLQDFNSKSSPGDTSDGTFLGTMFSLSAEERQVDIVVSENNIYVEPFDTVNKLYSPFTVEKEEYPHLFNKRDHNWSFIRAEIVLDETSSKYFLIITNNKPDHGAYSIDYGVLFDLETGQNVYKTQFPINGRTPWLKLENGQLNLSYYPQECSGDSGFSDVYNESFTYRSNDKRFVKVSEECIKYSI